MRHATMVMLAAFLLALPAQSQENEPQVLYCVDEGVTGFEWDDKGDPQSANFKPRRFTVRVISETERWISQQGEKHEYVFTCDKDPGGRAHCRQDSDNLMDPIIFGLKGYARAYLAGPPILKDDPRTNPGIIVAYGTCTKF